MCKCHLSVGRLADIDRAVIGEIKLTVLISIAPIQMSSYAERLHRILPQEVIVLDVNNVFRAKHGGDPINLKRYAISCVVNLYMHIPGVVLATGCTRCTAC